MVGQIFSCNNCEKEFDMRMKLNRHVAKAHKPVIDFSQPVKLTDDEKEQYFESLREKYLEIKSQAGHMERKFKYLESYLKTIRTTQADLEPVKEESRLKVKRHLTMKKRKMVKKPVGRENSTGTYEDIEGDQTIPEGWRSAIKNSYMPTCQKMIKNKVYWAPDGRYCSSRMQALAYMVAENHPKEQVDEMKEGMVADGWQTYQQLPEGWMAMKESKGLLKYATSDYLQLRNCRNALKYMLANNSKEEIAKFISFQFIKEVAAEDILWVEGSAIPFRWAVGRTTNKQGTRGIVLLCPDGQVYDVTVILLVFTLASAKSIFPKKISISILWSSYRS